jgi:hypothetical protein
MLLLCLALFVIPAQAGIHLAFVRKGGHGFPLARE